MNELWRHYGFGAVLLLVLASASFQVAAPDGDFGHLVMIVLGALTLVMSVWAAQAKHSVVLAATRAAVLLALASIVVMIVAGEVPVFAVSAVNVLLIAFAPAVIASGLLRDVREEHAVTIRTLSGVLAIYVLLGMLFSFLFAAAAELEGGPYFAGAVDPGRSEFLYFSYVTLATVGYGDLAAVTDVGRMLAVAEALIGQIYLVTVVALIVANLRPGAGPAGSRRPSPGETRARSR